MVGKTSSLRPELSKASRDGFCCWLWFWLDITEREILGYFLDLVFASKEEIDGNKGFRVRVLAEFSGVLGGFKVVLIH